MSYRRMFANGTLVCLAVVLVAVCHTRAHAQGSSSGSGSSSSGSTATAVGGGFTGGGGSTGSTATQTASGFTGTAGSGSNTSTGTTGRTGGASGASTTVPTAVNILQPTYINPYGAGLVNTNGQATTTKAFGQPLYSVFSTGTSTGATSGTASGGTGGLVASTSITGGVGFGYNSYGLGRTYNYVAVPGDTLPIVNHTNPQLQSTVADVLRRSVSFNALTPLKVKVNANTVIIDGTVATAKEKRLVEGMIRMTPGVRAVVNNLHVAETLPPPNTAALARDR